MDVVERSSVSLVAETLVVLSEKDNTLIHQEAPRME